MGPEGLIALGVVLGGGIYEFGVVRGVVLAAGVYLLMPYAPRR